MVRSAFMKKSDLDEKLMKLAYAVSKESDDPKAIIVPRSAVGVVIARGSEVLSKSANRLPPKMRRSHSIKDPEAPERYVWIEHAERCAIYDAAIEGISVDGATLYCTRFPCVDCARAICYFRISRLVVGAGLSGDIDWIKPQRAALKMLRSSGVTVRYLTDFD